MPRHQCEELREIVRADTWLMEALRAVRTLALPDWAIAGGAIRDRVWDVFHERPPARPKDVDVPYFDAADVDRTREDEAERTLSEMRPDAAWDVKNQAVVHEWFEERFGAPIAPAASTEDALSRWVETATCVGVRLEDDDSLTVLAPLGLEDLFGLRLSSNTRHPDRDRFAQHVSEKRFLERYPRLRLVEDT